MTVKRKSSRLENFEFERDGVFAHGKFTELGKYFRDSNRISGVSISTPVARWNNKPVNAAFDVTISKQDAEGAGECYRRQLKTWP